MTIIEFYSRKAMSWKKINKWQIAVVKFSPFGFLSYRPNLATKRSRHQPNSASAPVPGKNLICLKMASLIPENGVIYNYADTAPPPSKDYCQILVTWDQVRL